MTNTEMITAAIKIYGNVYNWPSKLAKDAGYCSARYVRRMKSGQVPVSRAVEILLNERMAKRV